MLQALAEQADFAGQNTTVATEQIRKSPRENYLKIKEFGSSVLQVALDQLVGRNSVESL